MPGFNYKIKQLLVLALLIALVLLSIKELTVFLPGLLGALTLYILSRGSYFQLIYHYKWKKSWAAWFFLLGYLLLMVLLTYVTAALLFPMLQHFFDNPSLMMNTVKETLKDIHNKTGIELMTESSLANLIKKITDFIPSLLNSTADLVANLVILLFILYYMLVHGKEIEDYLARIIPLQQPNIQLLATETKRLVRASAIGIPLISIVQGLTASVGYYLFGVKEVALWGFLTGVFAFFPVIGTMIIWVPLVIFMYADGNTVQATALFLYSLLVTGNVDYLARITILKQLGHVHPVVTVLGVLVGLGLFGFIGLIFGPLLVNYIILLFRIYSNEFLQNQPTD